MGKRKATRSEIIERNRKIVKDYEDGLSFEQLSEKYGLCVRTCYRALDEEQQAQRIAEEQDHANLVDKIVAEYQKNTAVRDCARRAVLRCGCRRWGFTIRVLFYSWASREPERLNWRGISLIRRTFLSCTRISPVW